VSTESIRPLSDFAVISFSVTYEIDYFNIPLILKSCGIPTAVREKGCGVRPLQRDARSARRIAAEAVKHVYQHGGSIKGDPLRL
jgi:hypothetical protein